MWYILIKDVACAILSQLQRDISKKLAASAAVRRGAVLDKPISFAEALSMSEGTEKHLLLGNGFSCAFTPVFQYGALYDIADFTNNGRLEKIFQQRKTKDFEYVIRVIENTINTLACGYGINNFLLDELSKDIESARKILIKAIRNIHPPRIFNLENEKFAACIPFFIKFSKVFTLNYDLLPYWVLLLANKRCNKYNRDGFSYVNNDFNIECLEISSIESLKSANLFYCHGSLLLFQPYQKTLKRKYDQRSGLTVLEQVDSDIMEGRYPLFVAEGNSYQKQNKINSNAYLLRCQQVFSEVCNNRNNALFIFGHSLNESDEHYQSIIREGSVRQVFVSMYRKNSEDDKQLRRRAGDLEDSRDDLKVTLFDANTANVWGKMGKADEHIQTPPARVQQSQYPDVPF